MATKKSETVKKKVAKKVVKKAPAADDSPPAVPVHLEIEMLETELLDAHPENRDVKNPECESLAESIRARGVREPVTVRRHPLSPGRYEIVSGHRRVVASRMAGLVAIPAMVREMGDLEALELVLVSNLERMELDPAEEARGVAALARAGLTPDVLAERLHRSREWVQLRLALGDLPAPMREAVAEKRVSLGAVAQVLRCEDGDRERAIQLVLRPTMQNVPLNEGQSREVLEREILGPQKRRVDWEKGMAKRLAAWKERLATVAKDAGLPVSLVALGYDDKLPGGGLVYALETLPAQMLEQDAPDECSYAHLAVRNGLPVYVVPLAKAKWMEPDDCPDWGVEDEPESIILVDARAAQDAERALAEQAAAEVDGEMGSDVLVPWFGGQGETEERPKPLWEVEREAKEEIMTALRVELDAAVEKCVLPQCSGRDRFVMAMWLGVFASFSDSAVSLDLASRIAGHPGVPYDEDEVPQWTADLQAMGEQHRWSPGWPLLAGYAEELVGVHTYMLGRSKSTGALVLLPESVKRIREGLEKLRLESSGMLPRLHELLEASAAAGADGSTDDQDADGEE